MEYVSHPWIHQNTIEKRDYQATIVTTALKGNTLCVIPTGLGKTSIAALVAAFRLEKDMNKKIMFLAPTKPLVSQHMKSFQKFLKVGESEMKVITGETSAEDRSGLYEKADVVFSTPQTIGNDLKKGNTDFSKYSLLIIDEAHRAIGNYAYTYVAKKFMQQASDPLILALTASPGGHLYKINEVKSALFINNVEIRTRDDWDVKPYVQELTKEFVEVEMSEEMKQIRTLLKKAEESRTTKLFKWGVVRHEMLTKSRIIKLQQELAQKKTGSSWASMAILGQLMKIDHCLMLLETQCFSALNDYIADLEEQAKEKRSTASLLNDEHFKAAVELTSKAVSEGKENPKIGKLADIIRDEFTKDKDSQIIVFVQLRATIRKIFDSLKEINGAAPVVFVGQAKKKGSGLSQKEQIQILKEFSMGFYNILIASQVGEEGLDIAETSAVIFYESVPSAVRRVQRSGRTGRTHAGKVITLLVKGTRDEAYQWSGFQKERKMHSVLRGMQKQQTLDMK